MPPILEKIEADFKKALRERDSQALSVLRMLKAALQNEGIAKKRESLTEADSLRILRRELKQRQESSEEWKKAGRDLEIEKEQAAIAIIEGYLPRQIGEEEVKKIAQDVINNLGAESLKDMGKVMAALMSKLGGKADGETTSRVVKDLLVVGNKNLCSLQEIK